MPLCGLTKVTNKLSGGVDGLAIRQKTECISLDLLDQATSAGIFRIPVEEETNDALARHQQARRPGDTLKGSAVPIERSKVTD